MTKALPVVIYMDRKHFFDERLKELRDCEIPTCYLRLNDLEVIWIKETLQVVPEGQLLDVTDDL